MVSINTGGTISNCSYFGGIDLVKDHLSVLVFDLSGKVIFNNSSPDLTC
ncbi:hypothetical protein MADA3029_740174 [Vibrio nigripulchritudo MADA3029]|nr:hypothetical protein VIBNIMADA3020_710107 [Vibrio nigripulchritudo MADA3020]CCN54249.1 hypothetical protein VIBNIMADA3021_510175 [Vibrio nigripulchritudo MADA3021]CCN61320.1 hypothetical protein MADA3029_740174 [Vibrio nigripulchritudo MADA3029]